jgi:hypothetical protein
MAEIHQALIREKTIRVEFFGKSASQIQRIFRLVNLIPSNFLLSHINLFSLLAINYLKLDFLLFDYQIKIAWNSKLMEETRTIVWQVERSSN